MPTIIGHRNSTSGSSLYIFSNSIYQIAVPPIMKGALLTAAVLLGSAQAGVHKMKLKKIPLSEQLETVPINHQMERLGQKYMGLRPNTHSEAMFQDTSVHIDANHPVPISNFMNAQCKLPWVPRNGETAHFLTLTHRLLRDRHWHSCANLQGCSRHWQLEPMGSVVRVRLHRLLSAHKVRFISIVNLQEERHSIRH